MCVRLGSNDEGCKKIKPRFTDIIVRGISQCDASFCTKDDSIWLYGNEV
jgi:hypothetical protein